MTTGRRARTTVLAALALTLPVALSACGRGFDRPGPTASATSDGGAPRTGERGPLRLLVGASGPAELAAVRAATDAWTRRSGVPVEITTTARLPEELAKGFAGGSPADLFYLEPAQVGTFARAGDLYPYGDEVADVDYLPSLRKTFTIDGRLQCAPKDFSTLALVVDRERWRAAGLTDADLPRDWAQLRRVATRLTRDGVAGLVVNPEYHRIGPFLAQAGGRLVTPDGRTATVDTPANLAGLTEVKQLAASGALKFAPQVDAGWGGEALLRRRAAMTIEGNWIRGALRKDAPDLQVTVAELPAGPAGRGTLAFTDCWGIAARSAHKAQAVDLVRFLAREDQQLAAARAFGVMPSTRSAMATYRRTMPQDAAFAAGAGYAVTMPTHPGVDAALKDFGAGMESLATTDPRSLLADLQADTADALAR